jgi:hypothetical protein
MLTKEEQLTVLGSSPMPRRSSASSTAGSLGRSASRSRAPRRSSR